jgi:2-oxo-3-hexenedioate decarboxylase
MDLQHIARQAFAVLGTGRQVAPFSKACSNLDLEGAYRVTAAVRAAREARGEHPVGRKIGFTNRTIRAEYNVHAPIWGYVYDSTVRDLGHEALEVSLTGFAEPRIEPEIVFGLAASPTPGMDERALIRCIDWIAHGFEIVQSIFRDWSFRAPDTVAACGLHGGLFIGPVIRLRRGATSGRTNSRASRSTFSGTARGSIAAPQPTSSMGRFLLCVILCRRWSGTGSVRCSQRAKS